MQTAIVFNNFVFTFEFPDVANFKHLLYSNLAMYDDSSIPIITCMQKYFIALCNLK